MSFCKCYHEIHNNLPRTKFCIKQCVNYQHQVDREQTKDIFDKVTPFLFDNDYDQVIKILNDINIEELNGHDVVAYLSATNPWKQYLNPSRSNFIEKTEYILIKEIGIERTENVLKGLR